MADTSLGVDVTVVDGGEETQFRGLLGVFEWESEKEYVDSTEVRCVFRPYKYDLLKKLKFGANNLPKGHVILARENFHKGMRIFLIVHHLLNHSFQISARCDYHEVV